jgi:hypothetical protein
MEKIRSFTEKISNYNYNYIPLGPRSDSYHDKLIFYCGTGIVLSALVSLGFKTNIRSTVMLGIGIPMGYLHRDLMSVMYDPTNTTALDALPANIDVKPEAKN